MHMAQDWGFAWQVGLVGFALVFVILIALYLALSFTGWLSVKYSHVDVKPTQKQAATVTPEKKAPERLRTDSVSIHVGPFRVNR